MKRATVPQVACGLLAAWLAWCVITATLHGQPQPLMSAYITSPLVLLAGVFVGGSLARFTVDSRLAGLLLGASAYLLAAVAFVGGAGGGPLGYSNANAALGTQLLAMTALLSLSATSGARLILLGAAAVSALAVVVADSDAANTLLPFLLAAVLVALFLPVRHRWWQISIGALGVAGTALAVTALTVLREWPDRLAVAFSTNRHRLWRDALKLWLSDPILGAGPGAFSRFSELAKDPTMSTAHMSLLQIGAETGLIGVILFVALIATGYALAARGEPAATLIASAALSTLLIHSFIDHLFEFWPVMLALGITFGLTYDWAIETHSGAKSTNSQSGHRP